MSLQMSSCQWILYVNGSLYSSVYLDSGCGVWTNSLQLFPYTGLTFVGWSLLNVWIYYEHTLFLCICYTIPFVWRILRGNNSQNHITFGMSRGKIPSLTGCALHNPVRSYIADIYTSVIMHLLWLKSQATLLLFSYKSLLKRWFVTPVSNSCSYRLRCDGLQKHAWLPKSGNMVTTKSLIYPKYKQPPDAGILSIIFILLLNN